MVAISDRPFMSAQEYLEWEATQEERYEYWDGEVVAMSGGTRNHNRVSLNLSKLLDDALVDRPCEVYMVDVKVQVEPGRKYFYPDVVVTCDERDRDPQWVKFPSLIVEILSPSTEAVDRGKKFSSYRQFPTLQEYVLVEVDRPGVEVFRRNERGEWVFSDYGLDDRLYLKSVDVEIAVSQLYRKVNFDRE